MLQAPSHLSRVCGHSHIKKFWLTQMQNESQIREKKNALLPSCSRPVCGSSVNGVDCKQSLQRNSADPSMKSLITGVSPSSRPRPVVPGTVTVIGGHGAASRHVNLATCAESLSPPHLSADNTYRSLPTSSSDLALCNIKEANGELDVAEEIDCSSFKVPFAEDISASSSRCGSPSADTHSRHDDRDVAENVGDETQPEKACNVVSPFGSKPATDGRDLLSSWEHCRAEGNVYASQEERVENFTCVDNDSSSENRSLELENSDSSADAGDSEYDSSPIRGVRQGALDSRILSLSNRAGRSGWTLAVPSSPQRDCEKRSRTFGGCAEDLSIYCRELSPYIENITDNSVLRVCSLCGTTKTPLWRSGPRGPKSLCNACGIRFKKSGRCVGQSEGSDLLASPLDGLGTTRPLSRPLKRKQDSLLACESHALRESGADTFVTKASFQHQKRSRLPDLTVKKEAVGFNGEIAGSSSESCLTRSLFSSLSRVPSVRKCGSHARMKLDLEVSHKVKEDGTIGRVISEDEEEAALLLMYLSCGCL